MKNDLCQKRPESRSFSKDVEPSAPNKFVENVKKLPLFAVCATG